MNRPHDIKFMEELGLSSNFNTISKDELFYYHRSIKTSEIGNPILVLIHGYPQSWRRIIPLLPTTIPLFIPDICGYGYSKPLCGPHDKRSTGNAILSALSSILPSVAGSTKQRIVIAGHDRGARISHRLAVDAAGIVNFVILGSIFLDIVPTLTQWQSFHSASASTSTFHWSFLANAELASRMILSHGGDLWARMCLDRWAGTNSDGLASMQTQSAMEVYGRFFKNEDVIRASCDDYRAGAEEDIELQQEDQIARRKINTRVLVVYSSGYLGKRYEVEKVWSEWMGSEGSLKVVGIGDDIGHFIAEEAAEKVSALVTDFFEDVTS